MNRLNNNLRYTTASLIALVAGIFDGAGEMLYSIAFWIAPEDDD